MDDIIEFILTILLQPFENKHEALLARINRIPNKPLKIFLKALAILIPIAILVGLYCLLSYLLRGYWL